MYLNIRYEDTKRYSADTCGYDTDTTYLEIHSDTSQIRCEYISDTTYLYAAPGYTSSNREYDPNTVILGH